MFGVNNYVRDKPRKRPGRHKKSRNKQEKPRATEPTEIELDDEE